MLAGLNPAQAQFGQETHSEAALVPESTSIQPGKPFTIALRISLENGWHTYWRNPGDSGYPVRLTWKLPAGFKAGPIQWPAPSRFPAPPLVTYGYEDEVWLLSQIMPPANLTAGKEVSIGAKADWLACREQCVPAGANLTVRLGVSDSAPVPDPKWSEAFTAARGRLPHTLKEAGYTARVERTAVKTGKANLELRLESTFGSPVSGGQLAGAYFYSAESAVIAHAAPQKLIVGNQAFRLVLKPSDEAEAPAKRLQGVLVLPSAGRKGLAVWIDSPVTVVPAKPAPVSKAKLVSG
jgi:thiol:disulfide interchange protein DsbD